MKTNGMASISAFAVYQQQLKKTNHEVGKIKKKSKHKVKKLKHTSKSQNKLPVSSETSGSNSSNDIQSKTKKKLVNNDERSLNGVNIKVTNKISSDSNLTRKLKKKRKESIHENHDTKSLLQNVNDKQKVKSIVKQKEKKSSKVVKDRKDMKEIKPIDHSELVCTEKNYSKRQRSSPENESFTYNEENSNFSPFLSGNEDQCNDYIKLFKYLVAPVKINTFFEKYWEKAPLYVARRFPSYYSGIFSSSELDDILRSHSLHYGRNIDVVSYENGVKEVFNQEGRAVPSALWDYYSNGCSIRILNPQTYSKKVHLLVTSLQEYFGSMVGVNVYLTPPESQGFAPHYDDIEAFVIQLEGKKHWKLYQPKGADVLARDSSPNLKREEIGKPFMEVSLEAGDLLYFPRGVIHEGHTDENAHSLHITVSVYQHNAYVDLMEKAIPKALSKAAEEMLDLRKGLPIQFLKYLGNANLGRKSKERDLVYKTVDNLMQSLTQYVKKEIDNAADQLGRKLMYDSMPPVLTVSEAGRSVKGDGDYLQNGKVHNRVEFTPDTEIRLLRYYCLRLVQEDKSVKIYYCTENSNIYHGEEEQFLELDTSFVDAVRILQNSYPEYVKVECLPIADEMSKMQFVVDLWERGLLVTSEPLMPFGFDCSDEDDDSDQLTD